MAKLNDKLYNRTIEGNLTLEENEQNQVMDVVVDGFDNADAVDTIFGLNDDDQPAKQTASDLVKGGVESAESGTIASGLGLDSNGHLVKGKVPTTVLIGSTISTNNNAVLANNSTAGTLGFTHKIGGYNGTLTLKLASDQSKTEQLMVVGIGKDSNIGPSSLNTKLEDLTKYRMARITTGVYLFLVSNQIYLPGTTSRYPLGYYPGQSTGAYIEYSGGKANIHYGTFAVSNNQLEFVEDASSPMVCTFNYSSNSLD